MSGLPPGMTQERIDRESLPHCDTCRDTEAEIERLREALESAGGFLAGWRHCRARQTREVIRAALNPHLPRPEWLVKFQATKHRKI